jgi:Zinc carboxypeptidase
MIGRSLRSRDSIGDVWLSRSVRALVLFSLFLVLSTHAQNHVGSPGPHPFDFYEHGPYREDIARPSKVFGYEPGEFHTTYAQYESLLRQYQEHSDRLRVFQTGKTAEHRSLYLLAISSPKNIARLDAIKDALANIADPRRRGPEIEDLLRNTPVAVWLSYSIHGSESAAFEAGIQVLYQLLASNDPALLSTLDNVVVLINPFQNPDGHERFATWYNAHGFGRPEHYAFEHQEPWSITGRLNHNFFDLNRDLISLSQPESQASAAAFLQWHPQVLADHHGQTKEYFFPPPALPINPNLPGTTTKWTNIFGKSKAQAFDQYGWQYFVRDIFDLFYPGYWDSWSSLHGAIGMTYETDGGGTNGYRWSRDDETVVTLRDGISKHFVASLNTVTTAAANREARLRDYRSFFESSLAELKRKYYLVPSSNPEATLKLVSLLRQHGIEVARISADLKLSKAKDSLGNDTADKTVPAGSLVVDTAQPYGRMANTLLEIETRQDPEFLKRQEEFRRLNDTKGSEEERREYEFYDVTAWSLPLAFGVETYFSDEPTHFDSLSVDSAAYPQLRLRQPSGQTQEIEVVATPKQVEPGVAYVFEPNSVSAMKLAVALITQGFRLSTSNEQFQAGDRTFARGSFIVRAERNPSDTPKALSNLSHQFGVPIFSLATAFSDSAQHGIGSETVFFVKKPKVALVAGKPVEQTSYGLLRFLLGQECGLDVVPISLEKLRSAALKDFNVVILPDGHSGDYKDLISEDQLNELKSWVGAGGILISIRGASEYVSDPDLKLTSSRVARLDEKQPEAAAKKPSPTPEDPKKPTPHPPKKESEALKPLTVPGAIVRARVDHHNFLTIGFDSDVLPVLMEGNAFLGRSSTGANVLTFDGDKLRISGFFWPDNTERLLRGTSALIDEPLDHGHIILFNTEPGTRMIWLSTVRLLLNAIVYGPSQPAKEED